jgi:hypothetical protein
MEVTEKHVYTVNGFNWAELLFLSEDARTKGMPELAKKFDNMLVELKAKVNRQDGDKVTVFSPDEIIDEHIQKNIRRNIDLAALQDGDVVPGRILADIGIGSIHEGKYVKIGICQIARIKDLKNPHVPIDFGGSKKYTGTCLITMRDREDSIPYSIAVPHESKDRVLVRARQLAEEGKDVGHIIGQLGNENMIPTAVYTHFTAQPGTMEKKSGYVTLQDRESGKVHLLKCPKVDNVKAILEKYCRDSGGQTIESIIRFLGNTENVEEIKGNEYILHHQSILQLTTKKASSAFLTKTFNCIDVDKTKERIAYLAARMIPIDRIAARIEGEGLALEMNVTKLDIAQLGANADAALTNKFKSKTKKKAKKSPVSETQPSAYQRLGAAQLTKRKKKK